MKAVNALLLAMGLASGFSVQAHTDNQDLCFPLAHGENGLGSRNSMFLPTLITQGDNWYSVIYITNASLTPVNVKLDFLYYDGSTYIPYDYSYTGQFNAQNSPLNIAILKPFQTGNFIIEDDNLFASKGINGKVQWQANKCIENALRVDVRTVQRNGSSYSQGLITLNGGNPF